MIQPLITCNEEKCCIHDSSAVQHGRHENVVTRTIYKADMSEKLELARAAEPIAGEDVFLVTGRRPVAVWPRTLRVVTLVDLSVGIPVMSVR